MWTSGVGRALALLLLVAVPATTTAGSALGGGPARTPRPESARVAQAPGFVLPVPPPPRILTPFRPPATRYGPGHRGVDLATPVGGQIRAAGSGVVVYAANLAGRGVVSIEHAGGLRTTYEPVTATVSAGQQVTAGDPIGVLEAGHDSCAPASCLHWGARLPDGSYLDPMALLTGLRVRLLPWSGRAGP